MTTGPRLPDQPAGYVSWCKQRLRLPDTFATVPCPEPPLEDGWCRFHGPTHTTTTRR